MRSFCNTSVIIVFTFTFVILFDLYSFRTLSISFWPCTPCASRSECDVSPPSMCIWGETRDACDRRVCAKGPGERCGGPLKLLGECGEGMMCHSDERCHGCSLQTLECHPDYERDDRIS